MHSLSVIFFPAKDFVFYRILYRTVRHSHASRIVFMLMILQFYQLESLLQKRILRDLSLSCQVICFCSVLSQGHENRTECTTPKPRHLILTALFSVETACVLLLYVLVHRKPWHTMRKQYCIDWCILTVLWIGTFNTGLECTLQIQNFEMCFRKVFLREAA